MNFTKRMKDLSNAATDLVEALRKARESKDTYAHGEIYIIDGRQKRCHISVHGDEIWWELTR